MCLEPKADDTDPAPSVENAPLPAAVPTQSPETDAQKIARIGISPNAAREDHIHPLPGKIGTVPSNLPKVLAVDSSNAVQWLDKGVSVTRSDADSSNFWKSMFSVTPSGTNIILNFLAPVFDDNMKLIGFLSNGVEILRARAALA